MFLKASKSGLNLIFDFSSVFQTNHFNKFENVPLRLQICSYFIAQSLNGLHWIICLGKYGFDIWEKCKYLTFYKYWNKWVTIVPRNCSCGHVIDRVRVRPPPTLQTESSWTPTWSPLLQMVGEKVILFNWYNCGNKYPFCKIGLIIAVERTNCTALDEVYEPKIVQLEK